MKRKIAIYILSVISLLTVISCFDEFDPNSYKPVFTINGFSATDEIKISSLVAYWPFDGSLEEEKSGVSGENSGTTFVNGFKGQALNLNVANKSYVTFDPGSAITGLQSFTISFWVNPVFVDQNSDNGIDGILGLVNLSNPAGFWGNIDWFVENGSNPNAAKIVAHVVSGSSETWMNVSNYKGLFNAWSNHTLTYDATTSKFTYYINGSIGTTANAGWSGPIQFVGSGPMVFGAVQFQTTPSIGCCGNQPWASYLTGQLDEVRIYNTALSSDEVRALVVLQGKGK
jgi:Concanavalin A-like lectin/glucanases superfamily